jgi:CheY-like chemotaxis protein
VNDGVTESHTDQLRLTDALSVTIMVVDDEPANVKLLDRTLRTFGYRNLLSTTDPRTVLDIYRQHGFDLIILDLNMPHMDGFKVMRQLQALGRDDLPPILILTAQHDRDHRVRALRGGRPRLRHQALRGGRIAGAGVQSAADAALSLVHAGA